MAPPAFTSESVHAVSDRASTSVTCLSSRASIPATSWTVTLFTLLLPGRPSSRRPAGRRRANVLHCLPHVHRRPVCHHPAGSPTFVRCRPPTAAFVPFLFFLAYNLVAFSADGSARAWTEPLPPSERSGYINEHHCSSRIFQRMFARLH